MIERLLAALLAVSFAAGAGIAYHVRAIGKAEERGYARAVADADRQLDLDKQVAADREAVLRDAAWTEREGRDIEREYHDSKMAAAERRLLAGTERLRCPGVAPAPHAADGGTAAVAVGPEADAGGTELVPRAAADLSRIAGTVAGLVRKLDASNALYERCRAVSGKPLNVGGSSAP